MTLVQRRLGALVLTGLAASVDVAYAANYFVSPTGRNDNPGTVGAPFRSINHGAARLRAGDTLWIRAGVYNESLVYSVPSGTSWTNKVRLAAYPGEHVTMRPTSGNFVLAFAGSSNFGSTGGQQYIEVDGVNLDGSAGIRHDTVKIEAGPGYNAHHIRLQNLTVTGNSNPAPIQQHPGNANAILITSLRYDAVGFNEFINLTVTGGPSPDVGNDFSSMFYIQTPDNRIENCLIQGGIGAGIQLFNANAPGTKPDRTVIRGNIIGDFTRSPATRGYGVLAAQGDGHLIYNNLIFNVALRGPASGGIYINASAGTEISYNTVHSNALYGIFVDSAAFGTVVRNNVSYGNGQQDFLNRGSNTLDQSNVVGEVP
jgi:parallel beta-helix repeat protein